MFERKGVPAFKPFAISGAKVLFFVPRGSSVAHASQNDPYARAFRSYCQPDRTRESLHRDGERFVVRADGKLTAFVELERAIHEFAVDLIS